MSIKCEDCQLDKNCPVLWHHNNAACLTLQKIDKIDYENFRYLLNDWDCSIQIDIVDLDYLDEYLKDSNIQVNIALIDLGWLYNRFSEEEWSAGWENNAEGQFINWLNKKYKEE